MATKRKQTTANARGNTASKGRVSPGEGQSVSANGGGPAGRTREYGVGAKADGSRKRGRGAPHARQDPSINEVYPSTPEPALTGEYTRVADEGPVAEDIPRLPDIKSASLMNVGKDPRTGKVIPHRRTEKIAAIVKRHAIAGTDENTICLLLNIRPGQLRQYYGHELDTAVAQTNADVAQAIVRQAKKGHPILSRFYAKARMGWRDGEQSNIPVSPLNIHIHT